MAEINLDSLSVDEVQQLKAELWSTVPSAGAHVLHDGGPPKPTIVAEGDSWFDYPPGLDILDHLRRFGYPVVSVAQHGDTLENMTYGSDVTRNYDPKPPQLTATLSLIAKHQPKVFLFSGGGNDVAGTELESYLDHARSPNPGLRSAYVDYIFQGVARHQYEYLIAQVKAVKPDIHIIVHGYGYAVPDGRAVIDFPFGFHFIGPWLKPPIVAKGFRPDPEGRAFVHELVDRFNTLLAEIGATIPNVHYIDLRGEIQPHDWVNELHLKNSVYERVAKKFDNIITSI